jgi:hypothetical protein
VRPDREGRGFWYWATYANPPNYYLAKMAGGKAAAQADKAIDDLVAALARAFLIFVVTLTALVIFRLIGLI